MSLKRTKTDKQRALRMLRNARGLIRRAMVLLGRGKSKRTVNKKETK